MVDVFEALRIKPTSDLTSAVMKQESGGRNYAPDGSILTSPKGAQYAMQVMPSTQRDPGFGVTPAADNSPEEVNRVGEDYLQAMMDRYDGNTTLAFAAYNAGPGNVDKWIQRFGDPRKGEITDQDFQQSIPLQETGNYVPSVQANLASGGKDVFSELGMDVPKKEGKANTPVDVFEVLGIAPVDRGLSNNAAVSFLKSAEPIAPMTQGLATLQSSVQQTGYRINKEKALAALDAFKRVDAGELPPPSQQEIEQYSSPQLFDRGGLPRGATQPLSNEGQDVMRYRQIAADNSIPSREKQQQLAAIRQKYADAVAGADIGVGTLTTAKERDLYKIGEGVSRYIDEALPQSQEQKERPSAQVGNAIGSLGRYVVTGLLTGGAGVTAMGVNESAQQQYRDAISTGASEQDAARAAGLGAPLGLIENLPVEKIIGIARSAKKPVEQAVEQAVESAWRSYAKRIGEGATFEGFQEWLQQTGSNVIARDVVGYDKDRDLSEGTLAAAGYGGGAGGFAAAVANAVSRHGARRSRVTEGSDQGEVGTQPDQAASAAISAMEAMRDKLPENSPTRAQLDRQISAMKRHAERQTLLRLPAPQPSGEFITTPEGQTRELTQGEQYAAEQKRMEARDIGLTPDVIRAQRLRDTPQTREGVSENGLQEKGNGRAQEVAPPSSRGGVEALAPFTSSPAAIERRMADLERQHDALPESDEQRGIIRDEMNRLAEQRISQIREQQQKFGRSKDVTADNTQQKPEQPASVVNELSQANEAQAAVRQEQESIPVIRRGKRAAPLSTKPRSLLEFLADNGGVTDVGGELKSRDLDLWHKQAPFRKKLVRPDTRAQGDMVGRGSDPNGPDEMTYKAWEAGFLPEFPRDGQRPTYDDMLRVIDARGGDNIFQPDAMQSQRVIDAEAKRDEENILDKNNALAENNYGAVPSGAFTDIRAKAEDMGISVQGRDEVDIITEIAERLAIQAESTYEATLELNTAEDSVAGSVSDIPFDLEKIDAVRDASAQSESRLPQADARAVERTGTDQRPARPAQEGGKSTAGNRARENARSQQGEERGEVNTPPATAKSTTPERKAPVVNEASPQLQARAETSPTVKNLQKESTGWKSVDVENGVVLVNPYTNERVDFISNNPKSGTDLQRQRAKAQAYAIDNPIAAPQSEPAEMIVKPLFERGQEQSSIPGTAPISDKQLAERKMEGRKQAKVAQKPVASDGGLFSDESKQVDLFSPSPKKSGIIDKNQLEQGDDARTSVSGIPEVVSSEEVPTSSTGRNAGGAGARDRAASARRATGGGAEADAGDSIGAPQQAGRSDEEESGKYSRAQDKPSGLTKADVTQAITKRFGKAAKKLIDASRVRIVQSVDDLPNGVGLYRDIQGFYSDEDGNVYLVADNLADATQAGNVFLHEAGVHAGMRTIMGDALFNKTLDDVMKLVEQGDKQAVAAHEKAVKAGTPEAHIAEETLAYMVDSALDMSLVKRVIAAVRRWAKQQFGITEQLKPEDYRQIAKGALRKFAKDQTGSVPASGKYSRQSARDNGTEITDDNKLRHVATERARKANADISRWWKRNLTREGLAPELFSDKVEKEGRKAAEDYVIGYMSKDFERDAADVYGKPYRKLDAAEKKALNDYLSGQDANIPQKMKDRLSVMRGHIDRLTTELQRTVIDQINLQLDKMPMNQREAAVEFLLSNGESGSVPEYMVTKMVLLNTLQSNKGQYLTRSYQAFDDEKWMEKALADKRIMAAARDGVAERSPDLSPSQVDAEIKSILEEARSDGNFVSFMARGGKLGSKDVTLLKKRKDLPDWYRELLGEYKDPKVNFTRSATKTANYVANHDFLMALRKKGLGTFLFEQPESIDGKDYVAMLAGENSDTMSPLNGLYVTRDFKQGMEDAMEVFRVGGIMGGAIKAGQKIKYGKTILNLSGQIRNFASNASLALANGHVSTQHLGKALSALKVDLTKSNDPALRKYVTDLIRRGVLHDGVTSVSLRKTLQEAIGDNNIALEGWKAMPEKLYRAGDDFWKINGYEQEKADLIASGMSESQAADLAATRIRDLYPTYSMTPRLLNIFRRYPFISAFPSWPWEQIRTMKNRVKIAAEDMKAGRNRMAAKHLAGITMAASLADMLASYTASLFGGGDDADDALRDLSAIWQRDAAFITLGRDEDGMMEYFDLSYLDALDYLKKPIRALVNKNYDGFDKKLWEATKEASAPFFGLDIGINSLMEIYNNEAANGGRVYDPNDPLPGLTKYIRRTVSPATANHLEDVMLSIQSETGDRQESRSGREYKIRDTLPALFGFRRNTMNAAQALKYRAYGFNDNIKDASRSLGSVAGSGGTVSDDEIKRGYEAMNRGRESAFRDIARNVESARTLGVPQAKIIQSLQSAGISKDNIGAILRGNAPPWVPNDSFLKSAMSSALASAPNEEQKKRIMQRMKQRQGLVRELVIEDVKKWRAKRK